MEVTGTGSGEQNRSTDNDKELESTQTNRVMIDKQDRRTQKMVGDHKKGGIEKQHMTHEGKTEKQTKTQQKMKWEITA